MTTGERIGLGVPHESGAGRYEEEESGQNCVRGFTGGAGTIETAKLTMLFVCLAAFSKECIEVFCSNIRFLLHILRCSNLLHKDALSFHFSF